MKRTILLILAGAVVGLIVGGIVFHRGQPGTMTASRKILYYRDPMNPQNTSPTPKKAPDGMDYVPVYEEQTGPLAEGKGVHIDPSVVQNIGVVSQKVEKHNLINIIRTSGNVDFDQRKIYSVNARVMGWVEELYANYTGQPILRGQRMFELYSPDLTNTQQEYLQAMNTWQAMKEKGDAGQEDSLIWISARQRLLNWGVSQNDIDKLDADKKPLKTMEIVSPVDGLIMEKMVIKGQNIMAGMELYKIADLSNVWVLASVYQSELPWVKTGQSANVELSYIPGKSFPGRVTFISPMLDMETRTAQVRIEVANTPAFDIKPGMFATVTIKSPAVFNAVAVPEEAIIHSGERDIVVIDLGNGYFEPRAVKLGVYADGYVQVLGSIQEGELVVVSSQFLIDSESNLKAAITQMSGKYDMNMPEMGNQPDTGMKNEPVRIEPKPVKPVPPLKVQQKPAGYDTIDIHEMDMNPRPDTGQPHHEMDTIGEMPGMDMNPKPDTTNKADEMENMGH